MKAQILLLSLLSIALCTGYGAWKAHNFDAKSNPVDAMVLNSLTDKVTSETNEPLAFIRVKNCETQQVAGFKYKLTIEFQNSNGVPFFYNAELFVIPWEQSVTIQNFTKVIIGAQTQPDSENDAVENQSDMISECQEQIFMQVNSRLLGSMAKFQLIDTQVVAGNLYTFKITFNNDEINQEKNFNCKVLSQPWMTPQFKVVDISDSPADPVLKQQQQMDGSWTNYNFDASNSEDAMMAEKSLYNYLHAQNRSIDLGSIKIISAQSQLIAGLNFRLNISYMEAGVLKQAVATIWVKSWENFAEVTNFKVTN